VVAVEAFSGGGGFYDVWWWLLVAFKWWLSYAGILLIDLTHIKGDAETQESHLKTLLTCSQGLFTH
jgi:hypothetical protein